MSANFEICDLERLFGEKTIKITEKGSYVLDWTYVPIADLLLFFSSNRISNKIAAKYGYTSSIRKSFFAQRNLPRIDTYILLCNIKTEMEAENLCLE